jgi:hypothetical protein
MFCRATARALTLRTATRVSFQYRPIVTGTIEELGANEPTPEGDFEKGPDAFRVPTLATARAQPRKYRELDNESLFIMAVDGEFGARKERLVREVMSVDSISWVQARQKVDGEINLANDAFAWLVRLPYKLGVTAGLFASLTAIPLVFHRPTAQWFCETFVFEDLPEGGIEALDSVWKVGNWTWGWMEPYLGTASFVLLGLQFTRMHMQRLHWKPYTEKILSWRANRLADKYPQYNRNIVRDFSKADPWHQ